ncbi:hypothetical protein [Thioclava sp. GXIMD4215]|uniref:hypothetical protein n=1 Tax=Thioclava sp. GXIMD4215 TaxID=3131928 RepID=UPI00325318C9
MENEDKDMAAYLVAAARAGSSEGSTREQFIYAAGIFWDSWHKAREFMSRPTIQDNTP